MSCSIANPDCDNPGGVPDGTVVEAYGVREDAITPGDAQTLEERATEIRNELRNWDSSELGWKPGLSLTGGSGAFASQEQKYVAVHNPSDWALTGWTDSPDLTTPLLQTPADEDVILSVWNPSNRGLIQDGLDADLPGAVDDDTNIVIDQLDYSGGTVDTRVVETSSTRDSFALSGASDHDYARVNLQPGFYRISAEGSDFSYVISVGSAQEHINMITEDLETRAGSLSDRATEIRNHLETEKVMKLTTTTYTENGKKGHFSFSSVPADVRVLAVQAYSPTASEFRIDDPANASIEDLREVAALSTTNTSFVVTPRARDVRVGSTDVEIKAVELDSSPFTYLDEFQNRSDRLQDLFENSSFADAVEDYFNTSDLSEENITEIRDRLMDLKESNGELADRYEELREQRNAELDSAQEEIKLLRRAIRDLQGELSVENPSGELSDGVVNAEIPWSGDLDPDAISVVAHLPGTGQSVPVPSEYWTVNKRVGQSDVVEIDGYPLPGDASMVTFGVTVSGEGGNGLGNAKIPITDGSITNPMFDIESVSVSSLRPGPDEQVTLTVNPSDESGALGSLNASVSGPNGDVAVTSESTDTIQFTTNGAGNYRVTMALTTTSGQVSYETMTLKADSESLNQPPSIRVHEGFTGMFPVVGDGLNAGNVKASGTTLTVTAVSSADAIPSSVHVYTSSVSGNYEDVQVRLMKQSGAGEPESVRKHVKVFVHVPPMNSNALVYRGGNQPVPTDGESSYGSVVCDGAGDSCTIRSYTDGDGTASFSTNQNPSFVQRAIYWARTNVPVSVPSLSLVAVSSPVLAGNTFYFQTSPSELFAAFGGDSQ